MSGAAAFRYHPDPLATGSAVREPARCHICHRDVEVVYDGPVYCVEEVDERICLDCIRDGSAARALADDGHLASFTDVGVGTPEGVPRAVLEEVAHRTPGFPGWQQEHWMFHCGDAAAFLGPVGADDLAGLPDARESLVAEYLGYGWSPAQVAELVDALVVEGQPTGYLFRCLHCGTHLAYADYL